MAISVIKGGTHNNNIGNPITLNEYTSSSNPYVFPSDGYVRVAMSSSSSASANAYILGRTSANNLVIGGYGGNSYTNFCTFVRKGMRCYVDNISNGGAVVFYPLT